MTTSAPEELHGGLGGLASPRDERLAALLVRSQPRQPFRVAAHVGDGAREDVEVLDQLAVRRGVGPVGDEVVEGGGKLHGAGRGLLDLRQHVGGRGVLVAGLHGGVELVEGVVDALDAGLQDGVDDVVDLGEVGEHEGVDLAVEHLVGALAILLQLVELEQGLVHAGLVDLELLLLLAQQALEVGAALAQAGLGLLEGARLGAQRLLEVGHLAVVLGQHGGELVALGALEVVGAVEGQAQLALELFDLVLVCALDAVLLVQGAVALTDHVGQLEVLGLDLALELVATVDGLLGGGGFELDGLEFLQQVQVLVAQLRVELGEGLVLGAPAAGRSWTAAAAARPRGP
ncbi:hypothetical protein VTK73DRAFT_5147 [Phialemonium thermophilum]|uniref:Uncharacterized protein n=1 Tax=Phialemonium thermophilum TaxID=223376 RepID=A0ABR3V358_9PEZI